MMFAEKNSKSIGLLLLIVFLGAVFLFNKWNCSSKNNGYLLRKNAVFYISNFDGFGGDRFCIKNELKGAHIETFKVLDETHSSDKNGVYSASFKGFYTIPNIEAPLSYQILNGGYTKDQFNVYFNNDLIPEADPLSFEYIGEPSSGRDKNNFYQFGRIIPNANDDET